MENFREITKLIPLDTRIKVIVEMGLITAITNMGFREEKSWTDSKEDEELLEKIGIEARELSKFILDSFKEWEEDGRPK